MKLVAIAIAIGMALAACGGDPYVGTWTLEQHLSGPPVAGCPTTTMTTRTITITPSDEKYGLHGNQIWLEEPVPTSRPDCGSALYELAPGGDGLVGTAGWMYLVSGAPSEPPANCPILDVRSI